MASGAPSWRMAEANASRWLEALQPSAKSFPCFIKACSVPRVELDLLSALTLLSTAPRRNCWNDIPTTPSPRLLSWLAVSAPWVPPWSKYPPRFVFDPCKLEYTRTSLLPRGQSRKLPAGEVCLRGTRRLCSKTSQTWRSNLRLTKLCERCIATSSTWEA